jgi:heat shock protein HtpX
MITALPEETVFEAKRRARRATTVAFVILVLIYAVSFNLMALAGVLGFTLFSPQLAITIVSGRLAGWWQFNAAAFAAGAVVAAWHFVAARRRPLGKILAILGGVPADANDRYHKRFLNIVQEAEVATNIRPIRGMVLPTTGLNACSVRAPDGAAVCATEGLISRLTRQELGAVVAREAARLVNEDSRLTTTACSLVNVFGKVRTWTAKAMSEGMTNPDPRRSGGGAAPAGLLLWLVATVANGALSLIYWALSRDRGYLADAHGVQMSKDPLALAEAINRIANGYRGCGDVGPGYEALFTVDPSPSPLAEGEGLVATIFSTHPPTRRRLAKLVAWAKADLSALKAGELPPPEPIRSSRPGRSGPPAVRTARREGEREAGEADGGDEQKFYVNHDGSWRGPYLPMQMLALKILGPRTWIAANLAAGTLGTTGCPDGAASPMRAADHPLLLPLFKLGAKASVSDRRCPRCKVALVNRDYEGAPTLHCTFCDGYLIRPDVLGRVIARREKHFSAADMADARRWRRARKGRPAEVCGFPEITCPLCGSDMDKRYHSILTKVVLDFCRDRGCGAVWADGGEIERVQAIVEGA